MYLCSMLFMAYLQPANLLHRKHMCVVCFLQYLKKMQSLSISDQCCMTTVCRQVCWILTAPTFSVYYFSFTCYK